MTEQKTSIKDWLPALQGMRQLGFETKDALVHDGFNEVGELLPVAGTLKSSC